MNTHIRYNTGRRERKNEETALTDKTFPLSERESMKKLYEEITAHIRSRFTDTKRDYEITERSVGRGLYGIPLEIHTAYGASRVAAGHFPMVCFYEDGIYDAELRTGSKKGMATVRKGKTCYSPSAGETKTLQLIAVASDYGEEPLIADIMIVAACKSILHWHTWEKWEHLVHSLSEQAEEVLREKGYELWHASTKRFVFPIIDAFEKSGYIKVTDKIPFEGLYELYAHLAVSALQLSRHLILAWIAAGLIVFGIATFIFKINILETLVCTAVTMTAAYAFLSIIQRKVIFKNYIEKEYSRLMDTFLDLQKEYNFFYYRKGTDNGLRRRALKDAAEKTQEA